MKPLNQVYPINQINEISEERYLAFSNKKKLSEKMICSGPGRRRTSIPPPAPFLNVIASFGKFPDEDGNLQNGMKFNCKANHRNILYADSTTPIYGQLFYRKFERVKFTIGPGDNWFMTPERIAFRAGDDEFHTPNGGSFITGRVNHPTEFWVYVDEEPLQLSDNRNGLPNDIGFEFILFFYSEQSFEYLQFKISEYSKSLDLEV